MLKSSPGLKQSSPQAADIPETISSSSSASPSAVHILDLSDELLLYIFRFVEDTDLQSLTRVEERMRGLASDIVLWRFFRLVRNSSMLKSRLFNDSRPSRLQLARSNIMRGVQPHQLTDGTYIYGPAQLTMHTLQQRISKLMREHTIVRNLRTRPHVQDLQSRGLIPDTRMDGRKVSPALLPRIDRLRRALSQASLSRNLNRRRTLADMHSLGVLQDTSIAPSIVAARRTLERRFTLGVLDRKVGDRPSPQDLREHNVLLGDANGGDALLTTSHANSETNHEFVDAAGVVWSMDDVLNHYHLTTKGAMLAYRMNKRPSVSDMERYKVLDVRDAAQMICPSVRPKIRHFEVSFQHFRKNL